VVRWLFLVLLIAAVLFGYGVYSRRIHVPEQYDPFTLYDFRAPHGPFTAYKRWRTLHDPQRCEAALAESRLAYKPMADTSSPAGCELLNVVRVTQADDTRFSSSFLATCPLALSIADFEYNTVQPAAHDVFGERVTRIEHVGSYACRNVNHQQEGALSQHATANAIDLTGFVLADGKRITLAQWDDAGSKNADFLRRVHDGACRAFGSTLGPDYNALHKTHFHVDMGPYSICR
jgi:hypothetical protein